MNEHEQDPIVARYLRTLPDPAPSAALWQRIDAKRRQRRRMQWIGYAAAASFAGIAAIGASTRGGIAPPVDPLAPGIAAHADVEPAGVADVRALDRQLQAAYERGADETVVQPLWEARNRAVADLATTDDAGPSISLL